MWIIEIQYYRDIKIITIQLYTAFLNWKYIIYYNKKCVLIWFGTVFNVTEYFSSISNQYNISRI